MGNHEAHHKILFLLVVFILLLAFFASGTHLPPVKPQMEALYKTPLRYTQPQPPGDPPGNIEWGQECGKPGPTKHLLDVVGKEEYGTCMKGLRCRQTGRRLGFKALCM
ncbi:MAG TPA: hypothetical protein VJH37_03105 [Candidatus Nanoarchaeia archaeon]|nr:hypothetical protein [Candidatus Nanoarchaeia archaeon]